ncbi:ribosomal protection-like ABC-F family protein [Geomicrobium sp. JSM 1781026]|uniref:ribosomal protection-like ABC-F family protein n=1 Tax=Geomicrobium sp. JSM 1781026 TaxID=3344580 RepID=UPI0035C015FA
MEKVTIELENIQMSYLDRVVLDIQKLSVHQFDRIGIVGNNGSGKSTLLKLMSREVTPSRGKVISHTDASVFPQLDSERNAVADAEWLGRLSVPNHDQLSGGEETTRKLAQTFSVYKEVLLLDEPTTHLDCEGVRFVIDELKYYYGAFVLVSHDRDVLDELVTKIWEVDQGRVTVYTGNYSDYKQQKELENKQQANQYDKYLKDKERLQRSAQEKMRKASDVTKGSKGTPNANRMFMTKEKGSSQKAMAKAAKAIEQRMDQLEEVQAPEQAQHIRFHTPEVLELHNKIPIMADRATIRAGNRTLVKDVSFQLPLGKTIAFTGANGAGKSTLLHHIANDQAGVILSPKVVIGRYEQMAYHFESDETVIDWIRNQSDYEEPQIRAVLSSMGFQGNDIQKSVNYLSGGEAIRLVLSERFLGSYNVLILDEPTTFLDVQSIEALEEMIAKYKGTVLIVSHDKQFIEEVSDLIYEIKDGRLTQVK